MKQTIHREKKRVESARMLPIHTTERAPSFKAPLSTVVVVGLGYVGLPLALLARDRGYTVHGIDVDPRKRAQIRNADIPDLDEVFTASLRRQPFVPQSNFSSIKDADMVIICVPTPVDHDHTPDLSILKSACESVAREMHKGQLIISESTVNPGTAEEVLIPAMEKISGLTAGVDFGFVHCPERINPGDTRWPIEKIPRVIGATTKEARDQAATFYTSILRAPVHLMQNIKEAEAVKMVENSFRDINIAFVNELAMSFTKLNIDVLHVLQGAATKPFAFMMHTPGCGVGGHCIPVDPYYLIGYAKKNGFTHKFLSLAREINNGMPTFTVQLLEEELRKKGKDISEATVALLGLSYKANVSDLRESPALEIAKILTNRAAKMRSFDPFIHEHSTALTVSEALRGADAVVIATAHDVFTSLSPAILKEYGIKVVIDGRNCLSKEGFEEAGVAYRGIGR